MGNLCADEIEGKTDHQWGGRKLRLHGFFLFHYRRRVHQHGLRFYHRFLKQQRLHHVYGNGNRLQGACVSGGYGHDLRDGLFPALLCQLSVAEVFKQWDG